MNYAFIFPGQGSQSLNMGKDLFDNFSFIRDIFDDVSNYTNIDFKELIFTPNERLDISEYTQPAILLNSLAHFLVLKHMLASINVAIKEDGTKSLSAASTPALGHSLGEFSALCASGAISLKDAIKLVNMRGRFMQECASSENPASMMVVLGLKDADVEYICKSLQANKKQVYAANYNCDGQIVLAGLKSDLASSEQLFKDAGAKRAMMLNMSVASHCPLMQEAALKLSEHLNFNESFSSVISNASCKPYSSAAEAKTALTMQLIKPVLYKQSIAILDELVDGYIEFGSSVLAGLNKKQSKHPTISLKSLSDIEQLVSQIKENQ